VKLVLDFKKRSKGKMFNSGLAYVKLEDEKSLTEALKEVERTHMDRTVKIVRAKPLSEKPPREPREPRTEGENRPERAPRGDRPRGDRPRGDRPRGDRAERPQGDRPERVQGDRPRGEGRTRGADRGGDRKVSGDRKKVYKPKHNDENSIYVGNLSFKTTEMKLGRHFEKYGDIKDVRIVEDDQERSRGFGYVEFEDTD
jgi:RNA recognition motif-containing protein